MSKQKILPYFINHAGCPHQCVFCNQRVINGHEQAPLADFEAFLTKFIEQNPKQNLPENPQQNPKGNYQLAFFGGSFTALPKELMTAYLNRVQPLLLSGIISSIRLSTRPDAIDAEVLNQLKSAGVTAIELGVQSLDDEVLEASNRGHSAQVVKEASKAIMKAGFELGHQLMLGLPMQTVDSFKKTVLSSIAMSPHTVRLYPVQVLRETPLAYAFHLGTYKPWELQQSLVLTAWAVHNFRKAGIRVIKIGLQAHEALMDPDVRLAGPYHPAYGEWVEGLLVQRRLDWGLESLFKRSASAMRPKSIQVYCHPAECSQVAGLSKGNRQWLQEVWQMQMTIVPDRRLKPGELVLEASSVLLALPDYFE